MAEPSLGIEQLFEEELDSRNVQYEKLDDGRYKVNGSRGESKISLENIARQYLRDNDKQAIDRFVDTILSVKEVPKNWRDVKSNIYLLLEGNDLEISDGILSKAISEKVNKHLIYYDAENGFLTFLSDNDLIRWNISEQTLWKVAEKNHDKFVGKTTFNYLNAGDLRLGVIEAEEPLKASLIISKSLKKKVKGELGWPIYAVAPSRGFVYLLKETDKDELGRLGGVVVKEFLSAEYPISTEVWKLSDNGIEAVGEFPIE